MTTFEKLSPTFSILIIIFSASSKNVKNILTIKKETKTMPCTLDKILEALDSRLEKLNANLKSCKEEARDCLAEMKEVKRLIKELHQRNGPK